MTSPGWYPDPQLPGQQQFFDGERWTGERRATDQYYPPQVPAPYYPPSQYQPAPPPYQGAPTPPPYQGAATTPPYQSGPTQPGPTQAGPTQPGPTPPGPYQPASAPSRHRSRKPWIIALVVVLVAGLATGGWFLFKPKSKSPAFTLNGSEIATPAVPLDNAAASLTKLVAQRHGAQSPNTRCYYAHPSVPPAGTKKSDVQSSAWCGPVVFVDGSPAKEYLPFALTSQPGPGKQVTLSAAAKPSAAQPTAIPGGITLARPDGQLPPSGPGGVAVPKPPATSATALLAVPLSQALPAAPSTAVIGAPAGGVRVTNLGPITRYGTGDAARSAPAGYRLIAFRLAAGYDSAGFTADLSRSAQVSINNAASRALPTAASGASYVLAAPTSAHSVDLVLQDGGIRQTISLLTGRPGAGNITVLARAHRSVTVNKTAPVSLSYSPAVVFGDGTSGSSETISLTAHTARLDYSLPQFSAKASKPSDALLYIKMNYTDPHASGGPFGLPPGVLSFTPTGGKAVPARDLDSSSSFFYNVYEVPGNLTSGVVTVSGSFNEKYNDATGSYKVTVSKPVQIPITFPAH
jgi:hypothetical protein